MNALAAVSINSANAANAKTVIRDVKILDLREREISGFVFINLSFCHRGSRLVNPLTTGLSGRGMGVSSVTLTSDPELDGCEIRC
jgi:hypothetical protein